MFSSIGPLELGFIFLIVLIIFGPKSLPRVGQALGRGIREFKDAARGLTADIQEEEQRRPEIPANSSEPTRDASSSASVIDSPAPKA